MSRKLILIGVLSLILAPGAALSLGLGDIRLNSYLNQPMNAEIALSVASPAELDTLRVELAPAEVFRRYGLERPAYFDELRFQLRRTGTTSAVVQVTSPRPIVEPFLTFLVEARWSGGRILREYTVLLDPPVFLPAPEAAPAPPPVVDAPRPAPVSRPAPDPGPMGAPAPLRREVGDDFGPVRRNDTLWGIAQRVRPDDGVSTNQVMVALFRANPNAFDGNINRLRAGAILRVPAREQMAAVGTGEANAEVRRHNEAWRAAMPAPAERRLELAPPTDATRPTAPVSDPVRAPAAPPAELLEAVDQLRGDLDQTRRMMEVKDAEIAALQARLAELEGEPAPEMPTPPAESPVPQPDGLEPEAADPAAVEPEAVEPEAEPAPAPAVARPAPVVTPPAPTLAERAMALLGTLWLWLALAALLVVAAVAVFLRKRRDEERSIEQDLAETGTWGTLDESGKAAATAGITGAAAAAIEPRRARGDDLESILVEEAAPAPAAPPAQQPLPAPEDDSGPDVRLEDDYQYPFEDTIAGETGINLDQSDPMAEADFHMAYGLYDQAAEIIKKAVDREPDRYDLRRKLIDICFVWGNADEFLAQSRAVKAMGGAVPAADWPKIAIMGRQICPGEPLFVAGDPAPIDIELGDDGADLPLAAADTSSSGSWLDFDVGESDEPLAALGDTREQPAPGTRRAIEQTAELDLEELGIDLDLGETGEHALKDLAESTPDEFLAEDDDTAHVGTVRLAETPPLEESGDETLRTSTPYAGEVEDDDGGTLMMDLSHGPQASDDPTQRRQGIDLAGDDPTLSGMEQIERTEVIEREDDTLMREAMRSDDEEPTLTGLESSAGLEDEEDEDRTYITRFEPADDSPTAELGAFSEELDLDLDDLTQMLETDPEAARRAAGDEDATQMSPGPSLAGGDADATMMAPGLRPDQAGGDAEATMLAPGLGTGAGSYDAGDTREMPARGGDETQEMPAGEVNEVGTKLDLARAYIDMGDPDGARSILDEVLTEGDEAQRQEARELLDGLD